MSQNNQNSDLYSNGDFISVESKSNFLNNNPYSTNNQNVKYNSNPCMNEENKISNINYSENNNSNNVGITNVEEKSSFLRKYSNKDPRTSLLNFGDTSYLNAVLQFIGHIPDLYTYFINPEKQKNINDNINIMPLSFVTERLFIHLYPSELKHKPEEYMADSYLKVLKTLNFTYKRGKYERKNPNDLLIFILETLHNEINNYNLKNKEKKNNNFENNSCDPLNLFMENFQNNLTIITQSLNWFQMEISTCRNCLQKINKFLSFSTFSLDIGNINKKEITIEDCLDLYGKDKIQKLICSNCNNKFKEIVSKKYIFSFNNTIIFMMDRGINFNEANELMTIHFKVEENINLKKFILNGDSPKEFKLKGILSIFKKENKYICFCHSIINDDWFICCDETVKVMDFKKILKEHNENKIYIPCILLYQSEYNNN